MAAYGALVPLESFLGGFLDHYDVGFNPPSLELAHYLYKEVTSFQEFLQKLDTSNRKTMNASLSRIAEVISKFHHLLSSYLTEQRLIAQGNISLGGEDESSGEKINQMSHLVDLNHLKQDIHSLIEAFKRVKEESPSPPSSSLSSKMVGFTDLHSRLKEHVVADWDQAVKLLPIIGMAGIGKTTLAKKIYHDLDLVEWFDCRAWVDVGREWQPQKSVRSILAQVNSNYGDEILSMDDDDYDDDKRISEYLKESLKAKRFLIVLDDVWDVQVWYEVDFYTTTRPYADGSIVLLTTRMQQVVDNAGRNSEFDSTAMRLMTKEESWELLREKVFGEESCPFKLEKFGMQIAEKCDGLPLTIITVGEILSKQEKNVEYWNEVATLEKHQVFMDAYDQVSKVLYPSYDNLPQRLKTCFLYMGVFPQNDEQPKSKVINMWLAEGLDVFEEDEVPKSFKEDALKCLDELASSGVMVYKRNNKLSSTMSPFDKGIKVCSLHSSWWHLCYKEARKESFFHVMKTCQDCLAESMKDQIRLSIHNNILLGVKEVYDSMEDNCASSAKSLLFYGPYSKYPVPICSALKLLKILDALKIRFYEFPLQVLELVKLKYLALTCDGELPFSLSKLEKLQFLIVCPHQNINSCGNILYLPLDIWDMKELKHIQVMGSDLSDFSGDSLPNLLKLLDVSAHSCTQGVFQRVHKLEKLGIRIEVPPDQSDEPEPLSCFDHISLLKNLKSLKCVVVNPQLRSELVPPPILPSFPLHLKKLALSGMGYPWEEMSKIGASLPKLQVLKLRCNAFQGSKWEVEEGTFSKLEYLLLEDCDLEHWKVGSGNFTWLQHLSIKHCYKLQELDWEFDETIWMVEIVDCDAVVEKQIKEANWGKEVLTVNIDVHYSWDDGKLKP